MFKIKLTRLKGEKSIEKRYYITDHSADPALIANAIRQHWGIENKLHWVLDISFGDDQSRIRDENGAMNMAWLRKTALALLKRADHIKGSIRRKQLTLWAKPQDILKMVKI